MLDKENPERGRGGKEGVKLDYSKFDRGIISRECVMRVAAKDIGIDDDLFEKFFAAYERRLDETQASYMVLDIKFPKQSQQ